MCVRGPFDVGDFLRRIVPVAQIGVGAQEFYFYAIFGKKKHLHHWDVPGHPGTIFTQILARIGIQ